MKLISEQNIFSIYRTLTANKIQLSVIKPKILISIQRKYWSTPTQKDVDSETKKEKGIN